ncbi:hypothetical protein ATO3_14120 [Marinibacterium profundimaris]|uniref:Uncharacterized protein n=2 Tax=Marinibacterium profundimaris TaxID=1679460 RepID=A0A225NHF7_9RHOB|nr:hypothetical protein ATO3_14120 [Marinibacterium profundimaris]
MRQMLAGLAVATAMMAGPVCAQEADHYLAIHVDENDPHVMNMALNNVENAISYFASQGETVAVELVAYGPGMNIFVADKTPMGDRIEHMGLQYDNLTFAACGNTLAAMSAKAGHDIALLSEATIVPSGVARLMELQEQGYSYVRP